jgi:fluoride exporter
VTPLLVALGALAGAPLRLLATRIAGRGGRDPALGTLLVNVVGSGLLGVVLGVSAVPGAVVALVGTGFCGTLTTFSTLGADVIRLAEERTLARALAYVVASLVLGLGAAGAAYLLSR